MVSRLSDIPRCAVYVSVETLIEQRYILWLGGFDPFEQRSCESVQVSIRNRGVGSCLTWAEEVELGPPQRVLGVCRFYRNHAVLVGGDCSFYLTTTWRQSVFNRVRHQLSLM